MFTTTTKWIHRAAGAAAIVAAATFISGVSAQDAAIQKTPGQQKPAGAPGDSFWVDLGFPVQRIDGNNFFPVVDFVDLKQEGPLDLYVADFSNPTGLHAAALPSPELSEYWIGVAGSSPDDALRAQLELPEGQGVVLTQVTADSPAEKAGFKVHDVLIGVDEKPLKELSDLAAVIKEKKDKPLTIKLIRAGKKIAIDVTPEKRPPSQTGENCPAISKVDDEVFIRRAHLDIAGTPPTDEEIAQFKADSRPDKRTHLVNRLLRETKIATKSCTACHSGPDNTSRKLLTEYLTANRALARTRVDDALRGYGGWVHDINASLRPYRLNIPQPGLVVTPPTPVELPDDMTVTITRRGKQPAQIKIQQNDQTWEATGDKLDSLPANVRFHVERLLGSQHLTFDPVGRRQWTLKKGDYAPDVGAQGWIATYDFKAVPPENPAETAEKLDHQLQRLKAELEEAQKALVFLRRSLPAPVTPPKPEGGEKK